MRKHHHQEEEGIIKHLPTGAYYLAPHEGTTTDIQQAYIYTRKKYDALMYPDLLQFIPSKPINPFERFMTK